MLAPIFDDSTPDPSPKRPDLPRWLVVLVIIAIISAIFAGSRWMPSVPEHGEVIKAGPTA